jgi:hypothetical protein
VLQAPGHDEELVLPDHLGVEAVGPRREADHDLAPEHHDELGGARVRVRRVEPSRREVDARDGDAQRVEPRERGHGGARGVDAERVRGAGRGRDGAGEEVVVHHGGLRLARQLRGLRVHHAEVLERRRVRQCAGDGRREQQQRAEHEGGTSRSGSRSHQIARCVAHKLLFLCPCLGCRCCIGGSQAVQYIYSRPQGGVACGTGGVDVDADARRECRRPAAWLPGRKARAGMLHASW